MMMATVVPPLRFCLLTTFYPPYNFGGDGIDVQRTARALTARGHHVTVVHDVNAYEWLAGRRPSAASRSDHGVEVIGLRSRLGVLAPFLAHQSGSPVVHGARIQRILAEGRFDVVVFNNVSLIGGPALLSYGGDALKIYMAHEHWLVCPTHVLWRYNREPCDKRDCVRCVLSYKRPPQVWRYTNALSDHARHIDMFIARSEFSRAKHREMGFEPDMEVLPYFLPTSLSQPAGLLDPPPPHDRPYFLFVGRLTRIKGVASIIPAFRSYPDADLLIIGDGEELRHLKALAAGAPNITFLGRVANEHLGPYYQHAIASIVPSQGFETFGIVLIEAFRYRTPVIARRIGPFPEIIEQSGGGALFTTDADLVEALRRLQRDPEARLAMATRAFEASHALWSEDVVMDRFLGLVEQARVQKTARATRA